MRCPSPLRQGPLSVLPVLYRIGAFARMVKLESWFRSLVPESVYSAGGGGGGGVGALLKLGIRLPWILRRFMVRRYLAYRPSDVSRGYSSVVVSRAWSYPPSGCKCHWYWFPMGPAYAWVGSSWAAWSE